MIRFELPRNIINHILAHAQSMPENEICGLISQKDQQFKAYKIDNVATDTQHLYAMDPKQQIDAMREIRQNGETLIAIYHSHPDSPAKPSLTDLQQAQYPDVIYLITSLNTKGVLEMQGFKLNNGQFENVETVMQGL